MDTRVESKITAEFEPQIRACEHPQELVVHLLRAIQRELGWVPDEGVELAARLLGLSPIQVEEVATFYDKLYRRPVGKRVIHLCDSVCCHCLGEEDLRRHLVARLGVGLGETTSDGVFTLLPTCCLGACDQAPAMMIGLRVVGRLDPEKLDRVLAEERAAALAEAGSGEGETGA
jgi:NADH-quinone oxidoreductase subunit E